MSDNCYVCYYKIKKNEQILCGNKNCNKKICFDCFDRQTLSQIDHKNCYNFYVINKGLLHCSCCQTCYNHSSLLILFKKHFAKKQIRTLNKYNDKLLEYKKKFDNIQNYSDNSIKKFNINYVTEEIINLKCPACKNVFCEFDGCYALECSCCSANFCAWCFEISKNSVECHAHVSQCKVKLFFLENNNGHFAPIKYFESLQNYSS